MFSLAIPVARAAVTNIAVANAAVAGQNDLALQVNTVTGDVSIINTASTSTTFTAYQINVTNLNSPATLNIGNPSPDSSNTISSGSGNPPYTNEKLLSEPSSSSPNYNASAATDGSNPSLWSLAQDGYNSKGNGFGLVESPSTFVTTPTAKQKSNAVTIPIGGAIDLGTIFANMAPTNALTFTFAPTNSSGGDTQVTYNGAVDYVGTPEPASCLGLIAFASGGLLQRRRRQLRRSV